MKFLLIMSLLVTGTLFSFSASASCVFDGDKGKTVKMTCSGINARKYRKKLNRRLTRYCENKGGKLGKVTYDDCNFTQKQCKKAQGPCN